MEDLSDFSLNCSWDCIPASLLDIVEAPDFLSDYFRSVLMIWDSWIANSGKRSAILSFLEGDFL